MKDFSFNNLITQLFEIKGLGIKLAMAVFSAFVLLVISRKFLQILQQSSYQQADFNRWLNRKGNVYKTRLSLLFMLSLLPYLLFLSCLHFLSKEWIIYVGFVFYLLFVFIYVVGDKLHKDKIKMTYTPRLKKLIFTFFICSFVVSFVCLIVLEAILLISNANDFIYSLRYAIILLMPVCVPWILKLANSINAPIERLLAKKYIVSAKNSLDKNSKLVKIAITGSYGKTSVKNILGTILSVKYKVLATPKSYNTPMGVSKSINDQLDSSYDIFIAEMGARHKGDIKELMDIVNPQIGVLCGITDQHLDTFKNIDEIISTKAELVKNIGDGEIFITADSENSLKVKEMFKDKAFTTAGLNNEANVTAQDINITTDGSSFTLNVDGRKIAVKTRLLGKHNISNICLASAVCAKLGLSLEEIAQGIMQLEQTPHRLEIVPNDKGFTILDDSYNCNKEGYKSAVETALVFGGGLIVVTPGLVELGAIEKAENMAFGKYLSKYAKYVVLVGSYGAYNVRQGLLDAGFDFEKIVMAKTLDIAKEKLQEIVSPCDTVLFENDIPDRFL